MKILVTGGAGFIGSWVVDTYLKHGYEVFVVDNLSNGKIENVAKEAKFFKEDIRNFNKLRKIFKSIRPTIVNHHAAQIEVSASVKSPSYDASVNIMGTLNILLLCKEFGIKKLIFASTGGALYGNPKKIPVSEDAPLSPLSPYGISKATAESYLNFFEKEFNINASILRYANIYGPRQDPYGEAGVVAIFAKRILDGQPCIIYGDGTQTRDFVYVEDVARVNLLALDGPNGVYNIGTGKETSINQIFKIFTKILPQATKKYAPKRKGEAYRIALDSSKVKKTLNWTPTYSLLEGLKKTVQYFKENG